MIHILKKPFAVIKSFLSRDNGSVTAEFTMLFPGLFLLVLVATENVLINIKKTKLDHALEVTIRDLRMGNIADPTRDIVRARLCAEMDNPENCESDMTVEMTVRDPMVANMSVPSLTATCVNRTTNIDPVLTFTAGAANQLVLVRVCYVIDVITTTELGGFSVAQTVGDEHSLISTSAFVNEPS